MASLCEREFNATSILHILFNSVLFSVELFNSVTLWSSGNPKCKMYVNVCNCEWENRSEKRAFNERKIPETENTTCAFFLLLVQHSYTFSILANIFAEICFNSSEKRNGLQCRWKCIRMLIMIKMSNAMKKYKKHFFTNASSHTLAKTIKCINPSLNVLSKQLNQSAIVCTWRDVSLGYWTSNINKGENVKKKRNTISAIHVAERQQQQHLQRNSEGEEQLRTTPSTSLAHAAKKGEHLVTL